MDILFSSNRDDPVLYSAYEYFMTRANCQYAMNKPIEGSPFITVTNHISNHVGKTIFYATDPLDDFSVNLINRRSIILWLNECDSVVCCSLYLAKQFYNVYRIQPVVQYPYIPRQSKNSSYILYSKDFPEINSIRNEIQGEQFLEYRTVTDILNAKLYLVFPTKFFDMGVCVAIAAGTPVIMHNDHLPLREFLESPDLILGQQSLQYKVNAIKKLLKECQAKMPSDKYNNMSALENKIRQALAKKPTNRDKVKFLQQPPPVVMGRSRNRVTHRVAPIEPHVPFQTLTQKTVFITGGIVGISGYDNFVYEITRGLKSVGIDVRINIQSNLNYNICPAYFRDIHRPKPAEAWEIIIAPPCGIDRWMPNKHSIIYTMWETDTLESSWVKQLNNAAFVIVPSQWAVDCFKRCGVRVPIFKIPLGYDSLIFNPTPTWPSTCTFGTAAALTAGGLRKNIDKIAQYFQGAFEGINDVKLKIKITPSCNLPPIHDSRIEITKAMLPPGQLANWYRSITTFVNCSYAEGFGLHLIEAMACGRSVISTNYSAVTEYFDDLVGYTVAHQMIQAGGGAYSGSWAKAVDSSMIEQMQRIYQNQAEVKEKGRQAFLRARKFTWKDTGEKLLKLLTSQDIVKV